MIIMSVNSSMTMEHACTTHLLVSSRPSTRFLLGFLIGMIKDKMRSKKIKNTIDYEKEIHYFIGVIY